MFNTISHDILIDRLCSYFNISSTALSWFRLYLTNWHQSEDVGGASSVVAAMTYDVSQGFVLGFIIFIRYTVPLGKLIAA